MARLPQPKTILIKGEYCHSFHQHHFFKQEHVLFGDLLHKEQSVGSNQAEIGYVQQLKEKKLFLSSIHKL